MTSWSDYYKATAGRAPRELFTRALQSMALADTPSRFAIDLGCGDGTETMVLLEAGWTVLALDQEPSALDHVRARAAGGLSDRLETQLAAFGTVALPPADFIWAGLSLFFCRPAAFDANWTALRAALRPGGVFAGHLLGERDSWAAHPDDTAHSSEQVRHLLEGLSVESFVEVEHDGRAVSGPKHWHLFEVIARRAAPES